MTKYLGTGLRKKVNIVVLALLGLFLCFGIFVYAKPLQEYRYEGSYTPVKGTVLRDEPIYQGISLKPGVYQVELSYETEVPLGYHCGAKDSTVYPGALMTNGENLYGGRGKTGYLMWLWESTDNLEIVLSYEGEEDLTTGELVLRETRLMGSMLIAAGMFFLLVFVGYLAYRHHEETKPFRVEQKKAIYGVAIISLIASAPFLLGVNFAGGDLTFHLHRVEGIMDGLRTGQFPVRIEPDWVHGHGYACGIFYCNLLLYIPALLRLVGFPITFSFNVYYILLTTATAWVAYACFGKMFKDRTIGLVCSALYTLSGYRIFKAILSGGMGENSALLFLPLVAYGFYGVLSYEKETKEFKNSWLPLSIGYAGLLQTHLLTTEITAFVTVVLCLVFVKRVVQKERFCMLVKTVLVFIGLSAWYLVPFLDYYLFEDVHIKHVSGRTIQEAGQKFSELFFRWNQSPTGVGILLGAALLAFLVLWLMGKWKFYKQSETKSERHALVTMGKFAVCMAIVLMAMSLTVFPWNAIQAKVPLLASLISSVQFPHRFLSWATVLCIIVLGILLWHLKETGKKTAYLALLVGVVVSLASYNMYLLDSIGESRNNFKLYNVEGMGRGYISGAEYVIEGTKDTILYYRDPIVSKTVEVTEYEKGSLRAEFTCVNHSTEEGYVDLPLLLYRGYRAENPETGEPLELTYGENYTVMVEIPGNFEGDVLVRFAPLWYWRIGEIITLLFYIWMVWECGRKKKRK